jgi:hypothetical protein
MELVLVDTRSVEGWGGFCLPKRFIPGKKALILGGLLCLLQALDGIFTSIGISRFGIDIEGNPLVRLLMEEYGQLMVLALLKALSVGSIVLLTCFTNRIVWLNSAMGMLNCAYLFMAILPWTYLLFVQPYIA